MEFILIMWMLYSPTNNGAGVAIHSVEFKDKASCYYAAKQMEQLHSTMRTYCAQNMGADWTPMASNEQQRNRE